MLRIPQKRIVLLSFLVFLIYSFGNISAVYELHDLWLHCRPPEAG